MIYKYSYLDLIDELNWAESVRQFDESRFEIYSTQKLIKIEDDVAALSRDM